MSDREYKLVNFGDSVLKLPSIDVEQGEDISELIAAMKTILLKQGGLGLAAQQVGSTKRVALIMLTSCHYCQGSQIYKCCQSTPRCPMPGNNEKRNLVIAINLRLTCWSKEMQVSKAEGCLSAKSATGIPYRIDKQRYAVVDATWWDERGWAHYRPGMKGMDAIIVQHEIDHLNGHCIADGSTREERKQYYRNQAEQGK